MREFFDKWARAKGEFRGRSTREDDFAKVRPDSAPRLQADAGIECIGCGVCYAACDVVKWNPDYLGPAALNRAWTLINDVRGKENARAPARRGRRRRLPRLPHARELHRALPEAHFAHRGDRRAEARGDQGRAARGPLSFRGEARLWIAQRASAVVLALCVVVHLVTIVYAVHSGLSAAEILARTRGSVGWFAFYSLFVLAVTVHAPIGLRERAGRVGRLARPLARFRLAAVRGILSPGSGMRAVLGVFA